MVNIHWDSLSCILLYTHRVVEKYWKIYFTSPKLVHLYSCVPHQHGDLEQNGCKLKKFVIFLVYLKFDFTREEKKDTVCKELR